MLARLSVAPVDNVVQRRDREPCESYSPEKTHNTTKGPEDHQAHPNRKDRESDSDLEDQFPECHERRASKRSNSRPNAIAQQRPEDLPETQEWPVSASGQAMLQSARRGDPRPAEAHSRRGTPPPYDQLAPASNSATPSISPHRPPGAKAPGGFRRTAGTSYSRLLRFENRGHYVTYSTKSAKTLLSGLGWSGWDAADSRFTQIVWT